MQMIWVAFQPLRLASIRDRWQEVPERVSVFCSVEDVNGDKDLGMPRLKVEFGIVGIRKSNGVSKRFISFPASKVVVVAKYRALFPTLPSSLAIGITFQPYRMVLCAFKPRCAGTTKIWGYRKGIVKVNIGFFWVQDVAVADTSIK